LCWRRSLFDWEKLLEEQLSQLLQGVKMDVGEVDSWVWKAEGSQSFTVNSAYSKVRRVSDGESSPTYSRLWRCKALPSAVFLA